MNQSKVKIKTFTLGFMVHKCKMNTGENRKHMTCK